MNYGKLVCLALSLLMACGGAAAVQAAQDPGAAVYKMGDVEIIAVSDAVSERSRELLIGDSARIRELMPGEKSPGALNVYVVKTAESTILLDTGWGPPRGRAMETLAKMGITADKIDVILLTHLHGDHVSGLVRDGEAVFPNARVYVSAAERAYWFSDQEMEKSANKAAFIAARQIAAYEIYGNRVRTFEPGGEVVPGISAIDESGHTPGHVGYLVEAGNKKLLFWGDLTHFTNVQMAAPEIAVVYDTDPQKAVAARENILAWVARDGIFVAGMHVEYPGVGKIRAKEGGGYVFEQLSKLD